MTLVEENIAQNLRDLWLSKDFLGTTSKALSVIGKKKNKEDFITVRSFTSGTLESMQKRATDWKTISESHIFERVLYMEYSSI